MLAQDQVLPLEPDGPPPLHAEVAPELVPLLGLGGMAEKLEFRLIKLARAVGEISRRDLVAEARPGVPDAERNLDSRCIDHILELDKHALSCLRAQVDLTCIVADGPAIRFVHQVELSSLREVSAAF